MVTLDNNTRWNSTFDSIDRALQLKTAIQTFSYAYQYDINSDLLPDDDWQELAEQKKVLQPFKT